MTRNKAEEIVRKAENLTVSDLLNLPPDEIFSMEQQLQEIGSAHRGTRLATKARNIILIISGRY